MVLSVFAQSQVYPLFYMMKGDTVSQKIANRASRYYFLNQTDSALAAYRQLYARKPSYRLEYNLAVVFMLQNQPDSALNYLKKYIAHKNHCECAYLLNPVFDGIRNSDDFISIKSNCDSIQKQKGIQNIELYNRLAYLFGKEQEILNASGYKNVTEQRRQLTAEFLALVDSVGFPSKSDISSRGLNHFQTLLLHADLFPEKQVELATKILHSKHRKEYHEKQLAYTIDRGLCNMNKPQLYGTILAENPKTKETCLYQYDNYKKLLKRRKKLDFQSVEEYLKNRNITK